MGLTCCAATERHAVSCSAWVVFNPDSQDRGMHAPSAMVCSCLRVGAASSVATYSRVMPADGCVTCCAHWPATNPHAG